MTLFFILSGNVTAKPLFEADVNVDITAENVVEAKKQAMAKARRDALNDVLLSVSTAQSVEELAKLNDNQIQHFISGVMVLMEKSSNVRYIADLRVTINEDVLKAYMAENNLPMVVGEEQTVLVVPLLEQNDGALDLWSDANFWRQAFIDRKDIRKGNLILHDIDKNLGNITAVEASRIYDMTEAEFADLSGFNNVEEVYVLKYSLKDGKVYVKSFPTREVNEVVIGDATPQDMIEAVLPFFKDVKKAAKLENLDDNAEFVNQKIEAVYSYTKLSEWLSLKRFLEANAQVKDVKVISMANGKVHFSFIYNGVWEKLQANLALSGYKMRNEGGYYAIN